MSDLIIELIGVLCVISGIVGLCAIGILYDRDYICPICREHERGRNDLCPSCQRLLKYLEDKFCDEDL